MPKPRLSTGRRHPAWNPGVRPGVLPGVMPRTACLLLAALVMSFPGARGAELLPLRHLGIDLSGPPVTILPADLDGDGRIDLVVVTAYTYWGQTSVSSTERTPEGLSVEVLQVVPTLVDRRELHLFLAGEDGSYQSAGDPAPLAHSVIAFSPGPRNEPVLALTDDGVAAVRYEPDEGVRLEPLLSSPPVLAGVETLLPGYAFTADLDGDGELDLMLPDREGLSIHTGAGGSLSREPVTRLRLPGDDTGRDGTAWRRYPLPRVEDVDGDAIPDLVVAHAVADGHRLVRIKNRSPLGGLSVLRGRGDGTFDEATAVRRGVSASGIDMQERIRAAASSGEIDVVLDMVANAGRIPGTLAYFGDIDGAGPAEMVSYEEVQQGGKGLRQEMKQAKRPIFRYRFFRMNGDFEVAHAPYLEFTAEGYPFDFDFLAASQGGFVDLDGDGRKDLVSVALDFSLWQIPKVLVARSIGAGLDFHLWRQQEDGTFGEVARSSLRGKLKVHLGNPRIGQLSQFAGDFDGDGTVDFVQVGGGRRVDIHGGKPGGLYPHKADRILTLEAAPEDAGRMRVRDLDGDGRSDILMVTPLRPGDEHETRPTRLDIYLTGRPS